MELEEFIKDTLVGIRNGVRLANDNLKTSGEDNRIFQLENSSIKETYVNFDVAVTATHETNKSGSGGIRIRVVDIGGGKEVKTAQESVSRIKFAIKVGWLAD